MLYTVVDYLIFTIHMYSLTPVFMYSEYYEMASI